jgi:CheY-like chemotaxis protein
MSLHCDIADTPLSAQQWDLVNTIRASGEALLTLITDILDFSKIEAGKMELSSVPYCLESTIEAAIEIAGLHAAKKRLHVAYNISPNVPSWIIGDAQRLQQILLNLLNNAIKFTDAGEILLEVWVDDTQGKDDGTASTSTEGAVAHQAASSAIEAESRGSKSIESAVAQRGIVDSTLRGDEADQTASPKPRYCEINFSVRDTGIGIGKDDLARLFRSFSQVDSSPTRRFGGSGLGLTISQKLAEAMGGRMWAESEGPSCGSNFRWCIRAAIIQPPRNTTQRADRRDSSDAVSLRGRKILLVEACPMVRQTMVSALQKWQCTVHAVASEAEAVASLALTPEFAGPALALAVGAAARTALLAKKPPSPADVSLSLRAPCPPLIPDANSYDDGVKSIKTEISAPQGQHTATATGTGTAVDTAAAACHGPYDVVVMDVGHSTLLHALMDAASPEEARRVVFLGWPGQDDPEEDQDEGQKRHRHVGHKDAHDPGASRGIAGACDDDTPPCHTGDNSLTSSPVYGSGTHATATTWFGIAIRPGMPADAPPPAYSTDALYDLPTKPAAVAPRAVTRPPSQRAQRRRQLGYAVVTRPVRQGRFRLGLEEVLGMDVAIAPGTDANVETTAAGASGRNDAGIDDAVCDSHHPSAATTAHAGKMNQGGVDASGAPRLAQSSFPFATGMESSPQRLTESPSISGSESELSRSKMTSSSAGSLLHAPYRRVPSSASSAMSREEFGTGMTRQRPSSHNLARPDSRLLIAEDNAINMRVALGILRRLGFTDVVTAADGEEAVEAVAAAGGPAAFKAMLIDLHMPRKGGMEAVRDILRRWPGQKTKIIAVTADATCTVYDQCMANGFTGWLAKPFRVEEFAKIMEDDR